jgi:hypothetical protein
MAFKTVYTEVEVDVDLAEFDTEDLLDELASRSSLPMEEDFHGKELLEQIYYLRRQSQPYEHLMDDLMYAVLGRIV